MIERSQHNISRQNISKNALNTLYRLRQGGYQAYLVGGCIRDMLLGKVPKDFDISTNATPEQVHRLFRNSRIIGRRFKIVHVVFGQEIIEVTTFRSAVNGNLGRNQIQNDDGMLIRDNSYGKTLEEDATRRDFTINALYKSAATGEIIDLTGGLDDLKNKTIRVLHDGSFIDDPTRILRGLKFSIRFGFDLDEHTKKLQENYLKNINYDMCYKRVKKELIETFNLNSQAAFEKFIKQNIYKLVTEKDVILPKEDIEELIKEYPVENVWLVYAGCIGDLSRLPLTKNEQKILDDCSELKDLEFRNDFEIYRAFEDKEIESVILYAVLKNEKIARHYLDDLREIKIQITGKDLENIGFEPSPKYKEIFDFVLTQKLENPKMTLADEINLVKENFFS